MEINGKKLKTSWIKEGLDKEGVAYCEDFAIHLLDLRDGRPSFNAMTTSQVRNYFGEMRRIQLKGFDSNRIAFTMLKPKLAYSVARVDKQGARIKDFRRVAELLMDQVENKEHYDNLVSFMEATVAYHKAYGGK